MKTSITILPELGRFGTTILKGIYQGNTPHISEWRTTTPNETVTYLILQVVLQEFIQVL
jgi:hypothetical protein